MGAVLREQINSLVEGREDKVKRVRELSTSIRDTAEQIEKAKHSFGIGKHNNPAILKKRIKELEMRISTERLSLKQEKELAGEIAKLEKTIREIREIEEKKSTIGKLERDIKALKEERDRLKNELDKDGAEIEDLKKEMQRSPVREAAFKDDFMLGEICIVKKKAK